MFFRYPPDLPFPWLYYEGHFKTSPRKEVKGTMQHNLKISIAKEPVTGGIVRCTTVSLRERLLRRLFGDTGRVMVIVPGGSVKTLAIQEVEEGGHE